MDGVPETSGDIVRLGVYDYDNRVMNPVKYRNNRDDCEVVTKSKKNRWSGTKKANKAKKKRDDGQSSRKIVGANPERLCDASVLPVYCFSY